MPKLQQNLLLPRCPHCSVAHPNLYKQHHLETKDHSGANGRLWFVYTCGACGGVVTAWASKVGFEIAAYYPTARSAKDEIPDRPRAYLQQAMESIHAPAGAVMLAASAVDAMLKIKNYIDGSLYSRIEAAVRDHVITPEMAKWAHEVRLDANDQRHSDHAATLPTETEAQRAIDFAAALAEFLFVLPGRVKRGIEQASGG